MRYKPWKRITKWLRSARDCKSVVEYLEREWPEGEGQFYKLDTNECGKYGVFTREEEK